MTRAQSVTFTYDTFMRLDANERLEKFQGLTPANQAALLREQAVRWRRVHAERLTPEQNQILADVAEFIMPEMFEPSRRHSDEMIKAFMSLEERISRALTPADSYDALTLGGMYLVPVLRNPYQVILTCRLSSDQSLLENGADRTGS